MGEQKVIKVSLVRSVIGTSRDHRSTIKGLGLRRVGSSAVLNDTPSTRGMLKKVSYLVCVEP